MAGNGVGSSCSGCREFKPESSGHQPSTSVRRVLRRASAISGTPAEGHIRIAIGQRPGKWSLPHLLGHPVEALHAFASSPFLADPGKELMTQRANRRYEVFIGRRTFLPDDAQNSSL